MRTQLLTKVVAGLSLFAALALVGNAAAAGDPRTCADGKPAICVKNAAQLELQRHGIQGAMTCRALQGFLRVRCTWRNAVNSGSVLVTFNVSGRSQLTQIQTWTCAVKPTPSCR